MTHDTRNRAIAAGIVNSPTVDMPRPPYGNEAPYEGDDGTPVYVVVRAHALPRKWVRQRDTAARYCDISGLTVIENVIRRGELWHHVSVSHRKGLPQRHHMAMVKHDFIGDEREAYEVWPPADRYVNDHPHVLHLWVCLDRPGGVLPDFRVTLTDGTYSI